MEQFDKSRCQWQWYFLYWGTCLEFILGYKGSKYKKFDTFEDAQDYMTDERNLYIDPLELDRKIF